MRYINNWKQYNEDFFNPRADKLGISDIFGGTTPHEMEKADIMLREFFNKISKKISLRDKVKSGFHSLKNKISKPIKQDKKDEITFINIVKTNIDNFKWKDHNTVDVLLKWADRNIEEDRNVEELQDICMKINNLIER